MSLSLLAARAPREGPGPERLPCPESFALCPRPVAGFMTRARPARPRPWRARSPSATTRAPPAAPTARA